MSSIPRKHCPTCDTDKLLTDFHRCKSKSDGLWAECKPCACARSREWRTRNPDKDRNSQRQTRERRAAKGIRHTALASGSKRCPVCLQDKDVSGFNRNAKERDGLQWLCRSCERIKNQAWRDQNRASVRSQHRDWHHRHREQEIQRKAQYRALNRDELRKKRQEYDILNPDKRRERVMRRNARKKQTSIGVVSYKQIWERDRGICYLCGLVVVPGNCHFDHVMPLSKGGAHTEDNIAVTHSWCNQKKAARVISL